MSMVWVIYKPKSILKAILIQSSDSSTKVKENIKKAFRTDHNISIRIRNQKGNLIPIDASLKLNTKKSPYKLELFIPTARPVVPMSLELKEVKIHLKMNCTCF